MKNIEQLQQKANLLRKWSLIATTEAGSGHPTSCLSAADFTAVLFDKYLRYDISNPLNPNNDRFILSKGHASPLLYALFAMSGAYPLEELKTLRKFGSRFEGHPVPKFEFTEAATGSLGQGLSVGAGLALIAKREERSFKTYVVLGDGELAEGQVWEAANFASYHKLNNLIAILDINRLAQSGEAMFGHDIKKYADRFKGFGFEVITINGHNLSEIDDAFDKATHNDSEKPVVIIAETLKGKGVKLVENKDDWHGKPLKPEDLEQAIKDIGNPDDGLKFELKKPVGPEPQQQPKYDLAISLSFEKDKEYATRQVFGEALAELGKNNRDIYTLDADVKNSTHTEDFLKAFPHRFIECFIAEQNMVSVAAGLSRLAKMPFVGTFAAFLIRAADQIRMARVSEANIKFVGSHVGVSIGEDGPSQMGLEDIAFFGALPDTIILQPSDAYSTVALVSQMLGQAGFVYMRTLRAKTPLLYSEKDEFKIGGSKVLKQSEKDLLTIAATGITVFEALKAAEELEKEKIFVSVIDCYSICPVDSETLQEAAKSTKQQIIITVEDHFAHGGFGDFVNSALAGKDIKTEKIAVTKISTSGTKEELLDDAGISAKHIIKKVRQLLKH